MMDLLSGNDLKELGIYKAVAHADSVYEDWSDNAFKILKEFVRFHDEPFMCEDVRQYANNYLPAPPNDRAWGAIILRGKKDGIIKHYGFGQVRNPRAHRANASLWQRN